MITHWIVLMLVWKSLSIVGRATLTAVKSLAMTTTAMPIAKSASQLVRAAGLVLAGVAIRAAYAKVRSRMEHRLDSLALLLLLPLRGE
ncbi:MAG: hypothetical protein ACTHN3_02265 [Solirubrobacterales bacterium]